MYDYKIHRIIDIGLAKHPLDIKDKDNLFYARLVANASSIHSLYMEIFGTHPKGKVEFEKLLDTIITA